MTIWLVECWIAHENGKVLVESTPFTSYDLAEQYIKIRTKKIGIPVWQANHAGYTRYVTPETKQIHAMEYIIIPKIVIDNLD